MKDTHDYDNVLGIMLARVEYANDPWKIGRVRIRIPSFHGVPDFTPQFLKSEELPWARPAFIGGCGEDFGFFTPPCPGTSVYVFFEDGDKNKPVYFASAPSMGAKQGRQMNNFGEEDSPLKEWYSTPNAPEVPSDVFKGKGTGVPERMVFKSQKGHTIIFDDSDGEESFSFIDRLGQILKFKCPVSKEDNEVGYRRKAAVATDGTQLSKGINPSILIQTGPTSENNTRVFYEIFQDHAVVHSENLDTGEVTLTEFNPVKFLQKTDTTLIEMTKEYMKAETRSVKARYDDTGYYVKYKNGQEVKLSDEDTHIRYDKKKEAVFTPDYSRMIYGDSYVEVSEKRVEVSASDEILFKCGEATVKLTDNKVFADGEEVHLNSHSDGEKEEDK